MISWYKSNLKFNEKVIFNNLNLTIGRNEKVLLSSKSGSGKTTLMKTAIGLSKLDSGKITIDGSVLTPENLNDIRKKIFYLDQDVSLPELTLSTLLEEIFSYKLNKGVIYSKKKLLEHLKTFELHEEILNKNIKELSGGERQRVGIIIGLLLNRPIWLLDEPTSALDKKLKEKVKDTILSLPITAIVISHDSCWNTLKALNWSNI